MPAADEGEVRVNLEMEVGSRLELVDGKAKYIEEIVRAAVPEAASMVASVGGSSWRGTSGNTADIRVALKPKSERQRSSEEIAMALRKKLANIPGMKIRTRAGQGLFLLRMGTGNADRLQIEVRGYDIDVAQRLALQVKKLIEHHLITRRLAKYLIEVQKWDTPKVLQLRSDLQIIVCKKCEAKFHNGEFYSHHKYKYEKKKNIELYGE